MRVVGVDVGHVHFAATVLDVIQVNTPHTVDSGCSVCTCLPPITPPTTPERKEHKSHLGPDCDGDVWWHLTVRKRHYLVRIVAWRLINVWDPVDLRCKTLQDGYVYDVADPEERAGLNDTKVIQRFIASTAPLVAEWAILRPDILALEQQVMRRSAPKRKGGAPTSATQAASDAFNERAKVLQGVITAMLSTLVGCPQFDKHGKNTSTMAWDLHDNTWWGLGPPTHSRGTSITKPQKKALAVRAVQGCIDHFGKRPDGWVERVWESNDVKFDLADSFLHALNLASLMTPSELGKLDDMVDARPSSAPSVSLVSTTKIQLAAQNAAVSLLCDGCDGAHLPPWLTTQLLHPDGCASLPPPLLPTSILKKHKSKRTRKKAAATTTTTTTTSLVVEAGGTKDLLVAPSCSTNEIIEGNGKHYVVYLLQSANGRSIYIGASNDPDRRLRQHNGELTKGAKRTRTGRPWRTVLRVEGFGCKPFESHSAALKFEKAFQCCKLTSGKKPVGPRRRVEALDTLLSRWVCPMGPLKRTECLSVPGSKIPHLVTTGVGKDVLVAVVAAEKGGKRSRKKKIVSPALSCLVDTDAKHIPTKKRARAVVPPRESPTLTVFDENGDECGLESEPE